MSKAIEKDGYLYDPPSWKVCDECGGTQCGGAPFGLCNRDCKNCSYKCPKCADSPRPGWLPNGEYKKIKSKTGFEQRFIIGDNTSFILIDRKGVVYSCPFDTDDIDDVQKYTWYLLWCEHTKSHYVVSTIYNNSKKRELRLHRLVTHAKEGQIVDHINHDTIDNRKNNLRLVSNRANCRNTKRELTSKYHGVAWDKNRNKWRAMIKEKSTRREIFLGRFVNEYDAAVAVDEYLTNCGENTVNAGKPEE